MAGAVRAAVEAHMGSMTARIIELEVTLQVRDVELGQARALLARYANASTTD